MQVTVVSSPLSAADADAVQELAGQTGAEDGVAPLNEHTLLRLHRTHEGDLHLLAEPEGGRLAGYAFLEGAEAELLVRADFRRHGVGTALVTRLRELAGAEAPVTVWAHGGLEASARFAERMRFAAVRELFRLRRDADQAPALGEPALPEGIAVRTFEPGRDDADWLRLNARAFADHPEQGAWGPDDLADRLAQPWFDPAGFFLAEDTRTGRLAGFHWTKVHEHPERHGEVYIVGVDPAYQGTGLGKVLTVIGVRHLHGRGLRFVELYVDGTNTVARHLYQNLGFQQAAVDVQYRST
jgi:mycothiol synthase